jgi:hypothetical protein
MKNRRLAELEEKAQRAGLTPDERAEMQVLLQPPRSPGVNRDMVQARKRGREYAEHVIKEIPVGCEEGFKNTMREWLGREDGTRPAPFDAFEATAFMDVTMSFGKHEGKRIRHVPLEYLDWLIADYRFGANEFKDHVTRYVLYMRSDQ